MDTIELPYKKDESFRDKLSTIDERGKRKWIYPKNQSGKFHTLRQLFGYSLLIVLFVVPFLKVDGEPLFLLDVVHRKFIIFSRVFYPQDFFYFGLLMITFIVFVALFTVVFGRLFCGWACPQTIFMELVYRKIEYWIEGDWKEQMALNKQKMNFEKLWKKTLKHSLFYLVAFVISNLFLSYLIGIDDLKKIATEPISDHIAGFTTLIVFSLAFYGVFAFLREQVCTNICPYGRMQGVLLGKDSLVIAYDYVRGEPRGKFKKNEDRKLAGKGDCIDCRQCVNVCPTGIDIRNGTQLECINCALCIDACNFMMESVGLPKGLIRYASEYQIKENLSYKLTARAKGYIVVLLILLGIIGLLLMKRPPVDGTILRSYGYLVEKTQEGKYKNLYTYKLLNKSNHPQKITIEIIQPKDAKIEMVGHLPVIEKEGFIQGSFFVILDKQQIKGLKTAIEIGVFDEKHQLIKKFKTNFLAF
ncbi:MAG: cytochrome c oxidase accessory protein CcoG [Bacteroidia bacterium]|nr:MAG: cytochrome c oxidase accessory protein CcoG [Bacteroidia bacterium]